MNQLSPKALALIEDFLRYSQLDTSKSEENMRLYSEAREKLEEYVLNLEGWAKYV